MWRRRSVTAPAPRPGPSAMPGPRWCRRRPRLRWPRPPSRPRAHGWPRPLLARAGRRPGAGAQGRARADRAAGQEPADAGAGWADPPGRPGGRAFSGPAGVGQVAVPWPMPTPASVLRPACCRLPRSVDAQRGAIEVKFALVGAAAGFPAPGHDPVGRGRDSPSASALAVPVAALAPAAPRRHALRVVVDGRVVRSARSRWACAPWMPSRSPRAWPMAIWCCGTPVLAEGSKVRAGSRRLGAAGAGARRRSGGEGRGRVDQRHGALTACRPWRPCSDSKCGWRCGSCARAGCRRC